MSGKQELKAIMSEWVCPFTKRTQIDVELEARGVGTFVIKNGLFLKFRIKNIKNKIKKNIESEYWNYKIIWEDK